MEVTLQRFSSNHESTIGLFFIDCDFVCYTIEDEFRTEKVYGDTRIDAGRYKLTLRTVGGFHSRYLKRYGSEFHKGMLWLRDVPNFEYVLIHIGNNDDDTAGCILVGNQANNTDVSDGFVSDSRRAYERIYPIIAKELEEGKEVWINIKDEGQIDFS